MRKMLLGALLFGTANLVATGCIFVSDDDDGGTNDVGQVNLSWTTDPGCPVGATTAELKALPSAGGSGFTNLFNCTDSSGFIDDLPVGTYDVFINITDGGSVLFAQSFADANVVVSAGSNITLDPFTILTDEAFFSFDWQINEGGVVAQDCALPEPNYPDPDCNAGGALPCPPNSSCTVGDPVCRLDAADVGFVATLVGNSEFIPEGQFQCAPTGTGQVGPFFLGDYQDVIISITDPAGASYYDADPIPTAAIDIGNSIEDLGTVLFDL